MPDPAIRVLLIGGDAKDAEAICACLGHVNGMQIELVQVRQMPCVPDHPAHESFDVLLLDLDSADPSLRSSFGPASAFLEY